jgi:hypothetical protein
LVTGGREFNNRARLFTKLDDILICLGGIEALIHGNARGTDTLAKLWAKDRGVACKPYPADWDRYGKVAGPIRNQRMIDEGKPDLCVAFPGGTGTADMVRRCRDHEIPVVAG